MQLSEMDSRAVPYGKDEIEWAHERPPQHRVRRPAVGDTVLYRHDPWDDPTEATVVWVQPSDDVDDPHLWTAQTDQVGATLTHQGRPLLAPRADPWPRLHLRTRFGLIDTREARLRGSPGWLPPDWRARFRPVPRVAGLAIPPLPRSAFGRSSGVAPTAPTSEG